MSGERRLARNILDLTSKSQIYIYQGIVTKVDGLCCSIQFGNLEVSGVRLRASISNNDKQIIVVPKEGTAVIVGSLSGDLSNLVVLKVDEIESIEVNGGKLGGLINIEDLTDKLNNLVSEVNKLKDCFNQHTHSGQISGTATPTQAGFVVSGTYLPAAPNPKASNATKFNKKDYEDTTVTH